MYPESSATLLDVSMKIAIAGIRSISPVRWANGSSTHPHFVSPQLSFL